MAVIKEGGACCATTIEDSDHKDDDDEEWKAICSWSNIIIVSPGEEEEEEEEEESPLMPSPPVQLMKIPGKDYGLVAGRNFTKGEVVFSEQAPMVSTIVMPTKEGGLSSSLAHCATCFQCMEPADTFFDDNHNLPMAHLWPNPVFCQEWTTVLNEYSYDNDNDNDNNNDDDNKYLKDEHDRILCKSCKTMYCCHDCHSKFHMDCCLYQQLMNALADVAFDYDDNMTLADHWEIVLGARIMSMLFLLDKQESSSSLRSRLLAKAMEGMCGTPDQVTILQAGIPLPNNDGDDDNDNEHERYTLEPFYKAICDTLLLRPEDNRSPNFSSLEYFERLVILVRRNAVDIQTTSLFTIYNDRLKQECAAAKEEEDYVSLLEHIAYMVAKQSSLSSTTTDLNEYGRIGCCCILPLFARLNHSCQPNLLIRDLGCTPKVELVAACDIQQGDELSICYLSVTSSQLDHVARNQRLQSRYLFTCQCRRCSQERQKVQEEGGGGGGGGGAN